MVSDLLRLLHRIPQTRFSEGLFSSIVTSGLRGLQRAQHLATSIGALLVGLLLPQPFAGGGEGPCYTAMHLRGGAALLLLAVAVAVSAVGCRPVATGQRALFEAPTLHLFCNSTGACEACPSYHPGDSVCATGYKEPLVCVLESSTDAPYQVMKKPDKALQGNAGDSVSIFSSCTPIQGSGSVVVFEVLVSALLLVAFPLMMWRKRIVRRGGG